MGEIRSYKFESYVWVDAESEEEACAALSTALYGLGPEWELVEKVAPEDAPVARAAVAGEGSAVSAFKIELTWRGQLRRLLVRLHLRRRSRYDALWLITAAVKRILTEYAADCHGQWDAGFYCEHGLELPYVEAAIATAPGECDDDHGEWLGRVSLFLAYLWD